MILKIQLCPSNKKYIYIYILKKVIGLGHSDGHG